MTIRAKQRLTLLALGVFAVWPLVHRGLVARYDITPWKFMGFAMYCVPKMQPLVEVSAYFRERRTRVDPGEAHMKDLRREVARFATFRPVWGELLPPDRIGEVASSILTRADRVEVIVTEISECRGLQVHAIEPALIEAMAGCLNRKVINPCASQLV